MKKLISLFLLSLSTINCMEIPHTGKSQTITNTLQSITKAEVYKLLNINLKKANIETLEKLTLILNVLCAHNESINCMNALFSLVPYLKEYEDCRYANGRFVTSVALGSLSDDNNNIARALTDRIRNYGDAYMYDIDSANFAKVSEHLEETRAMYLYSFYGLGAITQLASLGKNKYDISHIYPITKNFLANKHPEIKLVGGFWFHLCLSTEFSKYFFKIPSLMAKATINKKEFLKSYIHCLQEFKGIDTKTLNLLLCQIPLLEKNLEHYSKLCTMYLEVKCEDTRSILINDDFLSLAQEFFTKLAENSNQLKNLEVLYSSIYSDFSTLRKNVKGISLKDKATLGKKSSLFFALSEDTEFSEMYNGALKEKKDDYLLGKISFNLSALKIEDRKLEVENKETQPQKNLQQNKSSKNKKNKPKNNKIGLEENFNKQEIESSSFEHETQKINIDYSDRIAQWFTSAKPTKNSKEYKSYLYHTFSKLLDPFLVTFGIKTDYENKTFKDQIDNCYSMIGVIKFKDGSTKTMLFSICLGQKDNICYHRECNERDAQQLLNEFFEKNYWAVFFDEENFPELGKPVEPQKLNNKNDTVISEDEFCIKIYDALHDAEITLIKPNA